MTNLDWHWSSRAHFSAIDELNVWANNAVERGVTKCLNYTQGSWIFRLIGLIQQTYIDRAKVSHAARCPSHDKY